MSCAKCREWNCVQCGANMADKNSFGLQFAELRASQAQQASVIAELRQSIERLGEMASICTYNELGKVCSTCNCKRKVKGK